MKNRKQILEYLVNYSFKQTVDSCLKIVIYFTRHVQLVVHTQYKPTHKKHEIVGRDVDVQNDKEQRQTM